MHISIRVRCIFNFCYCQPFHHRCDKLEIVINRHLIIAASYFLRTSWELLLFSPSSEFLHCILRWYEERTWTEMTKVTRFTFWCTKKWSTINRGNYMNALNRRLIFMKCFLTNLCILSFAQHDKKKNWRWIQIFHQFESFARNVKRFCGSFLANIYRFAIFKNAFRLWK